MLLSIITTRVFFQLWLQQSDIIEEEEKQGEEEQEEQSSQHLSCWNQRLKSRAAQVKCVSHCACVCLWVHFCVTVSV